jgi:hypothetical protein
MTDSAESIQCDLINIHTKINTGLHILAERKKKRGLGLGWGGVEVGQ